MITRVCPICGQEFTAKHGGTKYCSEACKAEGARLARKDWEDRTNYIDRRREQMRQRRAMEAEERIANRVELTLRERAMRAKRLEQAAEERRECLRTEASAGDPHARMMLSNKMQVDYWRAFQDYELRFATETGIPNKKTVNGISIYDERFAEEVIQSIRDRKTIVILSSSM